MSPTADAPQRSDGSSPGPYYDDFEPGERYSHDESYTLPADEIVDFAETYDPQPFHTDETVARESFFEGLSASGWQTAAVTMRLFVEFLGVSGPAGSISLGLDGLRWHAPVRPGDELSATFTVEETREWDDDHGYLRFGAEVSTDEETKPTVEVITLLERRERPP